MSDPAYIQKLRSIPKQPFLVDFRSDVRPCFQLIDSFNQFGPSPLQFAPRLAEAILPDSGITIALKREDCNSPLAHGGNKVEMLFIVIIRQFC
jgi:1-aminocyclopropane-1-carboxylate deaminase